MRGCASLKLSGVCARSVGGAMARGWCISQSRPRVAVPSGLFPGNRQTCGSRLKLARFCFDVRSLVCSFFPNVSGHRRRLVRRTVERLVGLFMLIDDTPLQIWARYVTDYIRGAFVQNVLIWLREGEGDINFNIATAVIDKCSILGR